MLSDSSISSRQTQLATTIMQLRMMLVSTWAHLSGQNGKEISLEMGLRLLRILKERFPDVFELFQRMEPNEILSLGENCSFEFDEREPHDLEVLAQAVELLKS